MNIALIGYGKMGKLIEEIALSKGHTIVAKIHPKSNTPIIDDLALKDADVCIDFSHPTVAIDNIRKLAALKKNIIMGTTGWYDKIDEVKKIIEKEKIGFVYTPNFSIGVLLFKKIIEEASRLMNDFDEYDIAGLEMHHNQKIDSPSGTAKILVDGILKNVNRKNSPIYDSLDRAPKANELHFASVRSGSIFGTHTIFFDSPDDQISLTHQAKTRNGFAKGAVLAAEWLQGKSGFFSLEEILLPLQSQK